MIQKPFLKWAGGKARVLPHLLPLLPPGKRFIEPFSGSGVVFLNVDYPTVLAGEVNPDLVLLYTYLKETPEDLIEAARMLFEPENNTAEAYYRLRKEFNETPATPPRTEEEKAKLGRRAEWHSPPGLWRAAYFVYLNRHGFNGMCRYNSKGEFNIPFGAYKHPAFPEQAMRAFAARLGNVEFYTGDFSVGLGAAGEGDVVYCDPPYLPLSATASFTSYHETPFGRAEQERLVREAVAAAGRGATVLISNHNTPQAREIYSGADAISTLSVRRNIAASGASRGKVDELIALYAPKPGAR